MLHRRILVLWILIAASTSIYGQDTLEAFALRCDNAIGITVPDFNCDKGTKVPTTNLKNGNCDRPAQLHEVCDPGSRFQVLANTPDAYVVAHCRKLNQHAPNDGRYGDIAVIQHNRTNGATCFYQALSDNLDGNIKAPSKGTGALPWLTPQVTATHNCVQCHDNGPIIRSPYLTQITGVNALPGAGDTMFNSETQPYYFVGPDFASWKAFKVEVDGNTCNQCHRMGVSNVGSPHKGTSREFGIRATATSQLHKNPHGTDSPLWMLPIDPVTMKAQTKWDKDHALSALEIKECAEQFKVGASLPNSLSCHISQYTGVPDKPGPPGSYTAVWQHDNMQEIQVYGWSYDDYRHKYDKLWTLGWRLFSLEPYVVDEKVLYNAVWRQSTEGEIQVYGWTYDDYRKRYNELWEQGWRLKILQPYVVASQVRYTAVWKRSTEDEKQVYGWSYPAYRVKYNELWKQGWRLKLLQPFVVGGEVQYTAVWRKSTEGETQVYGWNYTEYRAKYNELWKEGWRLKLLQPFKLDGKELYTAVWKRGTGGEIQVYGESYADYRKKYNELWPLGWRLQILQTF
ncbi:MAG TPA: hypothetical protein VGO56_21770 [Pyrinomonadaceae bacterium]|jgi:hypothetical protein|nr:hypothetical protein [Pyrinomonadaceae bacterium]